MSEARIGGSSVPGAAPATFLSASLAIRIGLAVAILTGVMIGAQVLENTPERGPASAFSLLIGLLLGIVFQRGRFCFYCITRDFIQERNSGPMFAILVALAVGGVGYAVIFGAFLPNPISDRLPPDAHIGPVSWVGAGAGLAFGLGMTLSGACISGHLYRLGEGYLRAPFALVGSLIGFGLGFFTWQTLYIDTLSEAPVSWLPTQLGYGGALILHLALLGGLGLLFLRRLPPIPDRPGGKLTLRYLRELIFRERWNPLVTGTLVGLIGIAAYFRVEPLGVTAQIGSISRTLGQNAGLLADRLPGLDTFAGCATQVIHTITNNGFLVVALVLGAFAAALLSGNFKLSRLTFQNSLTAILGGILMGWGAMTALGCTVGTLLSGISAFAVSGWVFGAAAFGGVWLGLKLNLHTD